MSLYFAKLLSKIQIPSKRRCNIDKTAKVYEKCSLSDVNIGRYSYVGIDTSITNADIGNFCSIAGQCDIGGGVHPLDMVSTSPVFTSGKSPVNKNFASHPRAESEKVIIGNDVWIGQCVYIKAGVVIGDGAVIGAHSVVTHDVEPYNIVAGVPAKVIRKRFSEEIISQLMKTKWWNWSDDKIQKYAVDFQSPERLMKKLKEDT